MWEDAEVVKKLSPLDIQAIIEVCQEVRRALSEGDTQNLISLFGYKTDETARAQFSDVEEMRGSIKGQYEWMTSHEGLEISKVLEEDFSFELVAGGQAVEVVRKAGGMTLSAETDDFNFGFDLYLSKISGNWKITR